MNNKTMFIFTRTPLHVGAGSGSGYVDSPIQREPHTKFPFIPASTIKGGLVDFWFGEIQNGARPPGTAVRYFFGSDDSHAQGAGKLRLSEAHLLAFPVRSARGCFAWISCPLVLRRAVRDGVISKADLPDFTGLAGNASGEKALYASGSQVLLPNGPNGHNIVLEDLCLTAVSEASVTSLATKLHGILPNEPVWADLAQRLVIVSDDLFAELTKKGCEVATHVRISDETGTAATGGLFTQENVPSETLFYATLCLPDNSLTADPDPFTPFEAKLAQGWFQIGADATTGLGCCSISFVPPAALTTSTTAQP